MQEELKSEIKPILDIQPYIKKDSWTMNSNLKKEGHLQWFLRVMSKTTLFWLSVATVVGATTVFSNHHSVENFNKNRPDIRSIEHTQQGNQFGKNYTISLQPIADMDGNLSSYVSPLNLSNSPLEQSILLGNFQLFKNIIDNNPTLIQKKTAFGISPIALSVIYGQSDMVKYLLDKGANPNQIAWSNFSLLEMPTVFMLPNTPPPIIAYHKMISQQYLIQSGANISNHDYQFVKTHFSKDWLPFWKKYFEQKQQKDFFNQLVQQNYPQLTEVADDLKTIEKLVHKK